MHLSGECQVARQRKDDAFVSRSNRECSSIDSRSCQWNTSQFPISSESVAILRMCGVIICRTCEYAAVLHFATHTSYNSHTK